MTDAIELHWIDAAGSLCEVTVTLDQAAAIERGEPVVLGRRVVERFSRRRLHALRSLAEERLAQIAARRFELLDRWAREGYELPDELDLDGDR